MYYREKNESARDHQMRKSLKTHFTLALKTSEAKADWSTQIVLKMSPSSGEKCQIERTDRQKGEAEHF